MKLTIKWLWFDFWVGFFYDRDSHKLYFCPLPCVVICLQMLEWVRRGIADKRFTLEEFETSVQNVFSIITFCYYMILVSVFAYVLK